MKKALALAGLVSAFYAETAYSQAIPLHVDDGRPSLARTYDRGESDWYLAVPVIPYVGISDCTMLEDTYDLGMALLDLEAPEGDVLLNMDAYIDFAKTIIGLPHFEGHASVEDKINFGFFSKQLEFHGYVGGYGRADFVSRSLDEYAVDIDLENERFGINFGRPQTPFTGGAFADVGVGGNFVFPFTIGPILFRPSFGVGYRHREVAAPYISSDAAVYSAENIYYPDASEIRSFGDGFFFDMGLIVDFREAEHYTRPVLALSVDNLFSYMHYTENPLGLTAYDAPWINFGFEITPMGWFNIRADVLNIGGSPEYRFEIAKALEWGEFSAFARIHEQTLLGDFRDSFNLMAAFGNDYAQLRLYGSVDDDAAFGIGIQFGLGWKVGEFM